VLLVEDNEDTREVLRELLEMWGHQVEAAEDGFLVALTGYSGEHRTQAVEAGFDLHVVKPVNPDELEHLLGHLPKRLSRG
jgi:CheY-like chemotaxis protein